MLDMSDAFDEDTCERATVTRPGPVTYVRRKPVRGRDEQFDILASIQPIKSQNQDEFMRLPEGDRDEAECVVYTTFRLQAGDLIEAGGERFRVLSRDNWRRLGGFSKAILGGMKPGEDCEP